MAVDLSVFGRQRSLLDQQALQDEFDAKKAALALQAQLQGIQGASALQTLNNGGIDAATMLKLQEARQNHQDSLDLRRDQMAQQLMLAKDAQQGRIDLQNDKVQDKRNQQMLNDQNNLSGLTSSINQQLDLIDKVAANPGVANNFGLNGTLPNIPGGASANAKVLLDQLNANSFIQALSDLKSQSRTGASGLGALSEKEGEKVQSAAAALGSSQSYDSFRGNLDRYRQELQASKERLQNGFNNVYNMQQGPSLNSINPAMIQSEQDPNQLGSSLDDNLKTQLDQLATSLQQQTPKSKLSGQLPSKNPVPADKQLKSKLPSIDQFDSLPSGATFVDPDGNLRKKP